MVQVPERDLFQVVLEISMGTWGHVTARIKTRDRHVPNYLLDTKMCKLWAQVGDSGPLLDLSLTHWSLLKSRQKPEGCRLRRGVCVMLEEGRLGGPPASCGAVYQLS